MPRRFAAGLLVLALGLVQAAPVLATARGGCGRCGQTMKCCRAEGAARGRCGLSRACCSASAPDRLAAPRGAETSTEALALVDVRPPPSIATSLPGDLCPTCGRSAVPPDPPPWPSL